MEKLLSFLYAIISGLCTSLGVNILQYAAWLERTGRVPLTAGMKKFLFVLNICICVVGAFTFLLATGIGPVSVIMPLVTGSSLLGNMAVQSALGIERYTKAMRIGTYVTFLAVICLIDIGPRDQEYDNPLALMLTKPGIAAISGQFGLLFLGFALIGYLGDAPTSSLPKIAAYGVVVAVATALCASIGKILQLENIPPTLWFVCAFFWVVFGVISFGVAALAATRCDGSVYLPVRACIQLLVNAAMGMCVWQDWKVLYCWVAYPCVYVLIIFGVYSVSSYDLIPPSLHTVDSVAAYDPTGRAMEELARVYSSRGENASRRESLTAFDDVLRLGLETGNVDKYKVLDLTMQLLEKSSDRNPIEHLLPWVNDHVNKFRECFETANGDVLSRSLTGGRESFINELRTTRRTSQRVSTELTASSTGVAGRGSREEALVV